MYTNISVSIGKFNIVQRLSTFRHTFDVAVFVLAILVCGRFGLSLWPFRSDLWPFWSWPFCFVAVLDVIQGPPVKCGFADLRTCGFSNV